jgi:GNAT superfamily N-acetyltransferase
MVMSPNVFGPLDLAAEFLPPRSTQVGYGAHAATADLTYDAYREMYAALAAHFVDRGYFDHLVYIAPGDAAANEAFVSLGFGRTLVAAIRDVGPVNLAASAVIEVHAASSEDFAVVSALNDELLDHHARSPIFWPHLQEPRPALDGLQRSLIEDPDANAHFIAYQDGRPAGMNTFMAPDWINPLVRPAKTVYLYQGVVSESARGGGVGTAILTHAIPWARDHGYEHIALHYAAPNIPGARFWQSHGFHAIEYRMSRHIDDRMAWARSVVASDAAS